jgi:hypothetical protein
VNFGDKIEFIGLVVAIIALIVPIWLHLKSKNKKELSFEVLSSTSLLSINDIDIQKRLKITLDGVEIQDDIALVLVKIINSGNTAVKPSDFHEDITISTDCPIIWASIKESKPDNLYPMLETDTGELFHFISIKPLLINNGDEFIVKLLLKSLKNEGFIKVSSRIEGVNEIKKLTVPFPKLPIYLGTASIFLLASYPWVKIYFDDTFSTVLVAFAVGLVSGMISEYISYKIKIKKKNNSTKKHFSG